MSSCGPEVSPSCYKVCMHESLVMLGVSNSATLWTVARQAPLSMGLSRQEYWRELPFQSPGDLPNPGINPDFLPCRQILYHLNHQGNPPGTMNHISYFSLSIPSVLGRIINEQNTRVKICFCEKPLKCCHK